MKTNKTEKTKNNKTERVYVRVTAEKKSELKRVAEKSNLNISELILARIDNLPIKDYQKETAFFAKLNDLTQQLGAIGNNINQATIAIHHIKNAQIADSSPISEFNSLMREYLTKRNELSDNLRALFQS